LAAYDKLDAIRQVTTSETSEETIEDLEREISVTKEKLSLVRIEAEIAEYDLAHVNQVIPPLVELLHERGALRWKKKYRLWLAEQHAMEKQKDRPSSAMDVLIQEGLLLQIQNDYEQVDGEILESKKQTEKILSEAASDYLKQKI
jgi:hypothetical protein